MCLRIDVSLNSCAPIPLDGGSVVERAVVASPEIELGLSVAALSQLFGFSQLWERRLLGTRRLPQGRYHRAYEGYDRNPPSPQMKIKHDLAFPSPSRLRA